MSLWVTGWSNIQRDPKEVSERLLESWIIDRKKSQLEELLKNGESSESLQLEYEIANLKVSAYSTEGALFRFFDVSDRVSKLIN